ncbi:MAG: helix-hairpin-helix domain-containing protein [Candidatus Omnitrophica bacterium]|nr:helix-hairpin-helix domain-containing protein [Candidatus Omnitrophota bacterium]
MTNEQNTVIFSFLTVFVFMSLFIHFNNFPVSVHEQNVFKVKSLLADAVEKRKIDINRADIEELVNIPGIGPVLAKSIFEYRTNNGYFAAFDDLLNVKGIGPKKLKNIILYTKIQ